MSRTLPNQTFFSISQVSVAVGISTDTLRRLEAKGKIKPKRGSGKRRLYSLDDVSLLRQILKKPENKKDFTIRQAADILSISIDTLRRWEKKGKIKSMRTPGGHRRFSFEAIEEVRETKYKPVAKPSAPEAKKITQPGPKLIPTASQSDRKQMYFNLSLMAFVIVSTFMISIARLSAMVVKQTDELVKQADIQIINLEGQVLGVETGGGSAVTLARVLDSDFNLSVNGYVEGNVLRSTSTSDAPLVVANDTKVENLNADLLDGKDWADLPSLITAASPDMYDFTEFKDNMALDASTDIALGSLTLSTSGTGALDFNSTGQVSFAGNVDAENGLDVTGNITASGDLTVTGGDITLGTTSIFSGGDSTSLNNIDSINSTTEGTFEAALDFLRSDTSDSYTSGTLSFSDGTFLDLSAIIHNDTALQGIRLPQNTSFTSPTSGEGFIAWDTDDNKVQVYDGSTWGDVAAGGSPAFSAITSGTNTAAAMVVGNGASLTYSGTGTITASDLTCTDCLDFTEFADNLTLDSATDIALGVLTLSTSGTGALDYNSTGQVSFAGNVNAENGLDVTTADLTVGGANFSVAQATGNITSAGDIAVNGGDLTSSAATFNLLNATPTTLNIGGAATAVSIGAATGTTTINNASTVITGTLDVNGATSDIAGTLNLSGNTLTSTGDLGINPGGGDVVFTNGVVLIVGGHAAGGGYNVFANSTDSKDEAAIDADNDLYIGGDLEVDGVIYGDGSGITGITASSVPFSGITGSTNTSAAMVVGTGASLTYSGTGTITASDLTCTDCLDFTEFSNSMTLDEATDIALGALTLSTSGTGALDYNSTGQVSFAGNLDAENGLDVTTADLTVGGANFSVAQATGDITTGGDIAVNGGDITSSGALNVTPGGALIVGATGQNLTLQGAVTAITSTGATNDITLTAADDIIFTDAQVTNILLSDVDTTLPNSNTGIVDAINDAYDAATGGASLWGKALGVLSPLNSTLDLAVGGTATASAIFYVSAATGDITLANSETISNATNTEIAFSNGANTLTIDLDEDTGTAIDFTTSGTTDLTFNPTGNVGIGTTTPSGSLEIERAGGDILFLDNQTDNTSARSTSIYFQNEGVTGARIRSVRPISGSSTDVELAFHIAGNTEALRIVSSGNVGIAETSPISRLSIGTGSGVAVTDGTTDVSVLGLNLSISDAADYAAGIYNSSIDGDGLLIQAGDASDDFALRVEDYDSANDLFVVRGDGNVGVGTASPISKLEVSGSLSVLTGTKYFTIGDSTGHANERVVFEYDGANVTADLYAATGVHLSLGSGGSTDRVFIKSDGNVGIGDTSPSVNLNIGTANTTHSLTGTGANADLLVSDDFELDGVLYLDGGNLSNSAGTASLTLSSTPLLTANTLSASSWLVENTANVGMAALMVNQTKSSDIFTASASGTTKFKIANNGNVTITGSGTMLTVGGGSGKIDVGTVDPVYNIGGEKFATYMAGMIGVKEEVTNSVSTDQYVPGVGYKHVIDFTNLERSSDLWLFSKATDIGKHIDRLVVLLSSSGNTRSWYEIDKENFTLSIYSSRPTTISYRLTAPRFDADEWSNYNTNPESFGFLVDDDELIGSEEFNQIIPSLSDYEIFKQNSEYLIQTISGEIIEGVEVFANLAAANIMAGAVETKELIVEGGAVIVGTMQTGAIETGELTTDTFLAFQGTVDNLLIKGGLVSPSIQTQEISPIENSDLIINLENSDPGSTESSFGKLIIEGENSETIASIDAEGNATFSGTLESEEIKTNEIVADKIYANEIISQTGYFDSLNAATSSAITREEIEDLLREAQEDQALLAETSSWNVDTATNSANLDELTVRNIYITEQTTTSSLSVMTSVTVGSDLVIQGSGEGLLASSIDTLTQPLQIQSLGLAPIELMAGKVKINTEGDVEIAGDLYVAGTIESSGLTLNETGQSDTESGFSKLLIVKANGGSEVASIDASGSAKFASVTTNDLEITSEEGRVLGNTNIRDAVELPPGETSINVQKGWQEKPASIVVSPAYNTQAWVAHLSETGFTINVDTPSEEIEIIFWWAIW